MKTLKESILSRSSHGAEGFKEQRRNEMIKQVIDKVLNASSEFHMIWFLERNNLRLDKNTVKKIVNKLKRVLPEGALFGMMSYGVPQIAKQQVEWYNTINSYKYAYYRIEIKYAFRTTVRHMNGMLTKTLIEDIICLTEDSIYALDIPETKSILDELDTHFAKYVTQDEVEIVDKYQLKSKIGGRYRVYSFKDLTKEFGDKK